MYLGSVFRISNVAAYTRILILNVLKETLGLF